MKLAIMQPYFFPYIGYFQLMNAVDEFIIYDNIKYTKKGWINRNRILVNGHDSIISLPLKKDSDFLDLKDRSLAVSWTKDKGKLLNQISEAYRKSPFFAEAFPIVEQCLNYKETNLFKFLHNSLFLVKTYLGIQTPITASSMIPVNHGLKAEYRVLAICKARNATQYVNPIGGTELYSKTFFAEAGVPIFFLRSKELPYKQFLHDFVPWLSIIDVMMFLPKYELPNILNSYSLE